MNGLHLPGTNPHVQQSPEFSYLLSEHNRLATYINTFTDDINALADDIDTLRGEANLQEHQTNSLDSDFRVLESGYETVRSAVNALGTENMALRNQLHTEMLTVKEKWFSLKQQVTTLENQVNTLKDENKAFCKLKDDITMLKDQITSLDYELNTLKDDASHAEVRENALKARIAAQNARIGELEVRQDEHTAILQLAMQMLLSDKNEANGSSSVGNNKTTPNANIANAPTGQNAPLAHPLNPTAKPWLPALQAPLEPKIIGRVPGPTLANSKWAPMPITNPGAGISPASAAATPAAQAPTWKFRNEDDLFAVSDSPPSSPAPIPPPVPTLGELLSPRTKKLVVRPATESLAAAATPAAGGRGGEVGEWRDGGCVWGRVPMEGEGWAWRLVCGPVV